MLSQTKRLVDALNYIFFVPDATSHVIVISIRNIYTNSASKFIIYQMSRRRFLSNTSYEIIQRFFAVPFCISSHCNDDPRTKCFMSFGSVFVKAFFFLYISHCENCHFNCKPRKCSRNQRIMKYFWNPTEIHRID